MSTVIASRNPSQSRRRWTAAAWFAALALLPGCPFWDPFNRLGAPTQRTVERIAMDPATLKPSVRVLRRAGL